MNVPFTTEQFLDVIRIYNQTFFPLQVLFNIIALFCVYLIFKKSSINQKLLLGSLSFFWLWMGVAYHLVFFTSINRAAYLFGILFIIQGLLFAFYAFSKRESLFEYKGSLNNISGIIFIIYALIVYPVLGYFLGHTYPYSPTFGLPCPTTIFTFGILLFAVNRMPIRLLIIPLLWSIIGFSAAVNFTIYEDTGLLAAGLLGFVLILKKNIQLKKAN